jgi:hypothetical protein
MHRSGSSVITRGLQALGVDLGDHLMPPARNNNEKGFFEDLDIYWLNVRLLERLGSNWHRLDWFDARRLAFGTEFAEERAHAASILKRKMTGVNVFAFKDPRTAILLPFWQAVFKNMDVEPRYLLTVRNPLGCAFSIAARDKYHPVVGVYLWARHMIEAVVQTERYPRIFVSYTRMMEDPVHELNRIAAWLDLTPTDRDNHRVSDFCKCFLDTQLRRQNYNFADLKRSVLAPSFVIELYEALQSWVSLEPSESLDTNRHCWEQMNSRLRALKPIHRLALQFSGEEASNFDFSEIIQMAHDLERPSFQQRESEIFLMHDVPKLVE